jgi:uncharacterized protein (DUF433 family)
VLDRTAADPGLLTFYDLIELAFVREFIGAKVKLSEIVLAARKLREEWGTPYPFALNRIETDGQQLLLTAGDAYRNVARCQQVFAFAQEFFADIDVDERGLAAEWWPMGRGHLVVINPKRSFGAPIDIRSGVRTDTLYRAYLAEQDYEAVSDWYDVAPDAVRDAVAFEEQWLRAA